MIRSGGVRAIATGEGKRGWDQEKDRGRYQRQNGKDEQTQRLRS